MSKKLKPASVMMKLTTLLMMHCETRVWLILFIGLAWRDPELMRMTRPRPLLETPAYPDLAGSNRLVSLWVILGFSLYFLFVTLL